MHGYIASHRQRRWREKRNNNEVEKSGEERRRWLAIGEGQRDTHVVRVRVPTVVGMDGDGGGDGDGDGEIYTGCQPPNNVIALYKLRESARWSALKPPSAP